LEAFRTVYLQTRIEAGEALKVNNAIRAYVKPDIIPTLTPQENTLLQSIQTIPKLKELMGNADKDVRTNNEMGASSQPAATETAAAIAADAAANTIPTNPMLDNLPQKFAPNMTGQAFSAVPAPTPIQVQMQRPSVEPITPVPGSPAIQNGTSKPPIPEAIATPTPLAADAMGGAQGPTNTTTDTAAAGVGNNEAV
jgi:hypothetical protein